MLYQQVDKEQEKIIKASLLLALKDRGVKEISINFSGSGDSGDIDDIEFTDMNGNSSWSDAYQADNPQEFDNQIRDLFYEFVDDHACKHGDWVNNEGGYGTMHIDVTTGKWNLDYHQRTTEEYSSIGETIYNDKVLPQRLIHVRMGQLGGTYDH